jgi:hypothetical protein
MSIADKLTTIAENVPKVYEAGKKAEYDAIWDNFLYGKYNLVELGNCNRVFAGLGWNDKSFDPPEITIKPYRADEMFRDSAFTTDLRRVKAKFDFSECITMTMAFFNSNVSAVGVLDARKVSNLNQIFGYSKLETIEKLIVRDASTYSNPFISASNLKNIIIEGSIGENGFNVQWSDSLSHESLMSIINALQDKTSDTSGTVWTVTLGSTNKAKLTEEELAIADAKGWEVK